MTWASIFLRDLFLALNLYLTPHKRFHLPLGTSLVQEFERKKEKKRFQKRGSPPPIKKRFVKERLLRHQKLTSPKDHRFSDQRKLRRMYRNT